MQIRTERRGPVKHGEVPRPRAARGTTCRAQAMILSSLLLFAPGVVSAHVGLGRTGRFDRR